METETPIILYTSVSTFPPSCGEEPGQVCGPCGKCGNGETETECVGDDGTLYGSDASDCPAGQVVSMKLPFCRFWTAPNPAVRSNSSTAWATATAPRSPRFLRRPGWSAAQSTYPRGSLIMQSLDCAGVCEGTARIDECGVCSGGYSGHVRNGDMDCAGICFGNFTGPCVIELQTSQSDVSVLFSTSNGSAVSTVSTVMVQNMRRNRGDGEK